MAGALAGYLTAWLNVHLRIMQLLASILVMIALYSVNLRIMGKPNVALINDPTVFSLVEFGGLPDYWLKPLVLLVDRDRRQGADRPVLRLRRPAWRCAPPAATRAWRAPRASRPTA